jgi:hypothetical protein
MPTAQEIQATQGTRLSETNPWDSYGDELGVKMTPELASAVDAYSQKRWQKDKVGSETQEVLAEQREMNDELAQQYQWLTKEEYANQEARVGTVLDYASFIQKLRSIGLVCHYRQHPHHDKAILYISRNGLSEPELACWAQINGPMPELSMFNFDDHGVPLAEKRRGWRTCLLQIILKGFITEEVANKLFGKPRLTKEFDRYNSTLYGFRNRGKGWDAE